MTTSTLFLLIFTGLVCVVVGLQSGGAIPSFKAFFNWDLMKAHFAEFSASNRRYLDARAVEQAKDFERWVDGAITSWSNGPHKDFAPSRNPNTFHGMDE